MQPPSVQVLYDVTRVPAPGLVPAAWGALACAAGAGVLWLGRRAPRASRAPRAVRAAGTTLVVFGLCWALFVGGGVAMQHARLRAALRAGRYTLLEGVVLDRPPARGGTPGSASWLVESGARAHWYRYDDSPVGVGYRRAAPGDGGLRSGARVRITDVSGRIARLEVMDGRR